MESNPIRRGFVAVGVSTGACFYSQGVLREEGWRRPVDAEAGTGSGWNSFAMGEKG